MVALAGLVRGLARGIVAIGRGLLALARMLFGEMSWHAPGWLAALGRLARSSAAHARARPRHAGALATGVAAIALTGYGAWWWYEHQPKPRLVAIEIEAPGRTEIETEGAKPQPVTLTFDDSAAALELAGKEVASGIEMRPAVEGTWRWEDDRRLVFQPKNDWPIGAEITVAIDPAVLASQVRLADPRVRFKTAPFTMSVSDAKLHQDPQDAKVKRITATLGFSHPVDTNELERRIVLRQAGQRSGFLGIGGASTQFRVTYDKHKLTAYVVSEPIPVPEKDTRAELAIDAGVRAARGGPPIAAATTAAIAIPSLYSLRIGEIRLATAENERYEPDRVLALSVSADTNERELARNVKAWLLPEFDPRETSRERPTAWRDPGQIGAELLTAENSLKLTAVPGERENQTEHNFRFEDGANLPAGRYMYIRVERGLTSFGGYILAKPADAIVAIERFPRVARIVGAGSLLALSGERKLSVMARDVEALRVEIGRVLPAQLQHLVTQNHGRFAQPQFSSSNFDDSALVERFSQIIPSAGAQPGKPSYHAVDFTPYLDASDGGRRGVFFVKIESFDPVKKTATGSVDRRLVVVTDLGLIAKRAADGSVDVFAQSIHTGQPVAGAAIEVVGKNGLAVLSRTTDAAGRASFGSFAAYQREREPALLVARRANDMAFLPIGKSDRKLDVSRFDVGGVEPAAAEDKLSAYLFSDRGLYRPGDEMRFGMIVKATDWTRRLAGLPVEYTLTDPRGMVVRRERLALSASGLETVRHSTADVAPTGEYTLALHTVKDGLPASQIGAATVNVQEFQEDRLKMSVRLSDESAQGWVAPEGLKARVNLQNLFGTPAENRRVTARMTLSPQVPRFAAYRDFQFTDPQFAKDGFTEELAEAKTNERGETELDLGLAKFARATYLVRIVAQGFEAEGGRSVGAGTEQLVSNMKLLVGHKSDGSLEFVTRGARRSVELVAIDSAARPIEAANLTLARIERRFVSVLVKQPNGTYKYESRRKDTELGSEPFTIAASRSRIALATDQPGAFSYVVRDASGLDLTRIDYSVAGAANLTRALDKNAELQVTLNKRDFRAGEEISLSIVAPYTGAGLITIERERVFSHTWFKTTTTASTQKIKVPDELEGGGYVTVTFLRDPASDEIYASPLSYAVQPFSVALGGRDARIALDAPALVKPGEVLRIKHRAGQPARAIVFAIDEGILQVARYTNADPLGHFFAKRALGVETAQILDLVLPEFKRLILGAAPGGGDGAAIAQNLNPFKRRRDPPVAFWSGLVDTGPQGGEVSFTVPDYFNGSLRLMAVAVSDLAVGATAEKTTVRGDFVLSPNLPTTVAPGDEFEISVGVSNNVAGSGAAAMVGLALNLSEHLEVVGAPRIDLPIGELREGVATFRLRAKEALGSASVNFTASLATDASRKAGARTDVSVRPASPYVTDIAVGTVRNGTAEIPIARAMHAEHRRLEASVSHLPGALASGLITYLDVYPYECTEQLLSRAVPALVVAGRPELARGTGASARSGAALEPIIGMLRARQNDEGGFGLWAANHYVVDFVSVYAQHFLMEARERGHVVPADLFAHANEFLRKLATGPGQSLADERTRAYAIYLLTRQGIVTSNFAQALQKRLEEQYPKLWREDIAAAYLAASYLMMKQERIADGLLAGVPFGRARPFADYYDTLIHDAQLLELVARHFPERARKLDPGVLDAMAKTIQAGAYNTLSASYAVLAFDRYAAFAAQVDTAKLGVAEALRDGARRALALPAGTAIPRVPFSAEAARIVVSASGPLAGFYTVTQAGYDRAVPVKEVKLGMEILREYIGKDGKPATTVKQGDELEVRLRFRALDRASVSDVAIVDLLPGGFEIVPAAREDEPGWRPRFGERGGWTPSYADLREDRIVLYGNLDANLATFSYRIKATNAGTFTVPPAFAEGMYERTLRARSVAGKVTVQK